MEVSGSQIRTALVVDDSALQRMHAVELLRQLRIETIHEACDGVDALRVVDALAEVPELFIIDLEMPNMDGIELIQKIAERGLAPSLVVSSSKEVSLISSVRTMLGVLEMPVLDALQKPLTAQALAEAIARFVPARRQSRTVQDVTLEQLRAGVGAGHVVPYFQPKVDLVSGAIVGVESLARWIDPVRGMIGPDTFIPLAEQGGYIHELTLHLIRASLDQVARWNAIDFRLSLSLNLSPMHLAWPNLANELQQIVLAHGVEPQQVVWEVTESTASEDQGAALGTLARLRLKGFGLSIDDYGIGYSSLQQLSRIPFSELKVDKSFIMGVHEREDLRVILRAAVEMARQLNLTTVAEGIETVEDMHLLQSFGCQKGQGYLFCKPVAGETLPGWVRDHKARIAELVRG